MERDVDTLTAVLHQKLVAFLNAGPAIAERSAASHQREALQLMIAEDVLAARGALIAGNPHRALTLLVGDLAAAPDNQELRKVVAEIAAHRSIRQEAFSQVTRGMTEDQVRRVLGPPSPQHIRTYDRIGMIGWFYPKDANGAAAAVWFETRSGAARVTSTDWAAIPAGPARSSR